MGKNAAVVLLNDIKKDRDLIEKDYIKQKNRKFREKHILFYSLGFLALLGGSCLIIPTKMSLATLLFVSYGIGVPLGFLIDKTIKENKLKYDLERHDKLIKQLGREIQYIEEEKKRMEKEKNSEVKVSLEEQSYLGNSNMFIEEETNGLEGPVLRRKY